MFYLTKEYLPIFIPLGFIGIYRWFWYVVKLLAFCLYKPIKPRRRPRFISSRDVTILVPTIDSGEEIKAAVRTWLANKPFEVIFVTTEKARIELEELAKEVDPGGEIVKVITIAKPNKRNQMTAGINHVKTEITVFCDDDVIWPETMLKYMLAPFEDKQMGGVGTSQVAIPVGKRMSIWEILAAFRLSMRNIEITSSTYIDGGVCCLSGRTAAYRTCILRDPHFQWEFTHEFWVGKYHQHSGDDKFLTRWMHSHRWKTYIQCCPEAELQSTFKNNWRFLKQLLRWTRNTWRSDIKSLFYERHIWRRHPFVAFSMLDKFFNPLTLLAGPITVAYFSTINDGRLPYWIIIVSYLSWLFITRLIKYAPHFVKRPQDVFSIPVWLIFNIVFAIMKVYCLFTLRVTDWGTRVGADDNKEKEDLSIYQPRWMDDDGASTYHGEEDEYDHGYSSGGSDDDEKDAGDHRSSQNRRMSKRKFSPESSPRSGLRGIEVDLAISKPRRKDSDRYSVGAVYDESLAMHAPRKPSGRGPVASFFSSALFRNSGGLPHREERGGCHGSEGLSRDASPRRNHRLSSLDLGRPKPEPPFSPNAEGSTEGMSFLSLLRRGRAPESPTNMFKTSAAGSGTCETSSIATPGMGERSLTAPTIIEGYRIGDELTAMTPSSVEEGRGVPMRHRSATLMSWASARSGGNAPHIAIDPNGIEVEEDGGRASKRRPSTILSALSGMLVPHAGTLAEEEGVEAADQGASRKRGRDSHVRHQPPPPGSTRVIKSAMRKSGPPPGGVMNASEGVVMKGGKWVSSLMMVFGVNTKAAESASPPALMQSDHGFLQSSGGEAGEGDVVAPVLPSKRVILVPPDAPAFLFDEMPGLQDSLNRREKRPLPRIVQAAEGSTSGERKEDVR
ncbi:hypothetical protein HDU67_002631 [Dinochytrium kinnereticum]|nr:hypothetical protein HDU67_002631 [Dinochytrium kinnereticum]